MKRNYKLDAKVISIYRPEDKYTIDIKLYSHFTGIIDNSGSGKTHFLEYVRSHRYDGVLEFQIPEGYELSFAIDEATLVTALNQTNKQIIFVDEPSVCLIHKHIKQVNTCSHLFVLVSRGFLFNNAYPLNGIYNLYEDENLVFKIQNVTEFPICSSLHKCDVILTESAEFKSEHRLLSQYFPNVKSVGSNSKIARCIEEATSDIVIFCDLGNIGFEYSNIVQSLEKCKYNVYFYDYACYEQLLLESPVILGGVKKGSVQKINIF